MRSAIVCLLSAAVASTASAADVVVDASGGGDHTNIGAAMNAIDPGDRILVLPGDYPAFLFWKEASIVGLGASPADVNIARCDYHPTVPTLGYRTLLSNLSLGSDNPLDAIALSGNELAPGVLHVEGVQIDGGVFLRGDTGFAVHFSNCDIAHQPGEWFSGEAMLIGGPDALVEMRNSRVQASAADDIRPAAHGIRFFAGTIARLVDTSVRGGEGATVFPDGGVGVLADREAPGCWLRLDAGSLIEGGHGGDGAGGAGIDLQGTIELGDAAVVGGAGSPSGPDYAGVGPTPMVHDLHLHVSPAKQNAQAPVHYSSGDSITLSMDTAGQPTAIAIAFELGLPTTELLWIHRVAFWIPGRSVSATIPFDPSLATEGLEVHAQGFTIPAGARLQLSDLASLRIDIDP